MAEWLLDPAEASPPGPAERRCPWCLPGIRHCVVDSPGRRRQRDDYAFGGPGDWRVDPLPLRLAGLACAAHHPFQDHRGFGDDGRGSVGNSPGVIPVNRLELCKSSSWLMRESQLVLSAWGPIRSAAKSIARRPSCCWIYSANKAEHLLIRVTSRQPGSRDVRAGRARPPSGFG